MVKQKPDVVSLSLKCPSDTKLRSSPNGPHCSHSLLNPFLLSNCSWNPGFLSFIYEPHLLLALCPCPSYISSAWNFLPQLAILVCDFSSTSFKCWLLDKSAPRHSTKKSSFHKSISYFIFTGNFYNFLQILVVLKSYFFCMTVIPAVNSKSLKGEFKDSLCYIVKSLNLMKQEFVCLFVCLTIISLLPRLEFETQQMLIRIKK